MKSHVHLKAQDATTIQPRQLMYIRRVCESRLMVQVWNHAIATDVISVI